MRAAGIPDDIEFVPKARLDRAMLERVIEAGVPFAWFTADGVNGQEYGRSLNPTSDRSPGTSRPSEVKRLT